MADGGSGGGDRDRVTAEWRKVRWETHRLGGFAAHFNGWGLRIRATAGGEAFRVSIVRNLVGEWKTAERVYGTVEDAKLGCLEAVLWAMKNMRLDPPVKITRVGTPAYHPGWDEMRLEAAQARLESRLAGLAGGRSAKIR